MTAKTRAQLLALFSTGQVLDQGDFQDNFDSFINVVDTTAQSINSNLTVNGTLTVDNLITTQSVSNLSVTNLTAASATFTKAIIATAQITGVINGADAPAGIVGQYEATSRSLASKLIVSTAQSHNVINMALTAGDWHVDGNVWFDGPAGTTLFNANASISTTSSAIDTTPGGSSKIAPNGTVWGNGDDISLMPPSSRVNVSASTNVYLVANATYSSASGVFVYGSLSARRMR